MRKRLMKKVSKGLISLLLVLTVTASMFTSFDLTVFAEEEPARGSEIYALLYYIDPTLKKSNGETVVKSNLELVFQKGNTIDPEKAAGYIKTYSDFADENWGADPPWHQDGYKVIDTSIYKVDIKDKIAPTCMSGWFHDQRNLVEIKHIENIITSDCQNFNNLFNYSWGLRELDLTSWDMSNATSVAGMFSHQGASPERGLLKLNISNWVLPKVENISTFLYESQIEELDMSSMRPTACKQFTNMLGNNKKLRIVKIGQMSTGSQSEPLFNQMFENCESLESVYSEGEPVYGKIDLSGWTTGNGIRRFTSMFKNCAKIKEIDFGNLFSNSRAYSNAFNNTFAGCTSLESIKFNFAKGGLCVNADAPTFKDCKNLVELDFSGLETPASSSRLVSDLSNASNIYEGCTELKQVTFNQYYPPAERAGVSVPPKPTWARIKNADGSDFTGKEVLSANQLFLDFQPSYAGTWVAVDKIVLNADGGKPVQQSIDGSRGIQLEYDPSEIEAPSRNGYDFDDWYSEKNGEGVKLEPGTIAQAWIYYANWNEHKYTLVLDGNGGTVPADYNGEGTVSADRKTITFENLNYSQFQELSKNMFSKNDDSVLASWNTRKNGKGTSYYATDSVNKLTEADGATAILYAQWHTPDAVVKFDSNGGSAVDSKEYTVGDSYGNLTSPYRVGYTFLGWYTPANELGEETKITADSVVTGSVTLKAKWEKNPVITFDANGGKINGENTTTKVCSYGYGIGSLPVPNNGSATLKGWYTEKTGVIKITNTTLATEDVTYYAQWGWQPKFETNGGSFTSYPEDGYAIADSPSYTITELPTVEKNRSTFDGWYFGDTKLEVDDDHPVIIDLSSGNVIKAKWNDTVSHTVTLNYNDGKTADASFKVYDGNPAGQLPAPVRDGYTFDGWYSGSTKYSADAPAITGDVTLTAKWTEKNCTVTFDPQGGTMVDTATVKVVEGQTLPRLPGANYLNEKGEIKYRFGGWYSEPNGEGTLLTTNTAIDENKTYYAKWVDLKTQSDDDYIHSIHWATISNTEVTNTGGHLVFHPTVKGDINARLYISIEKPNGGTLDLPANALTVTIPRHLFESDKEENNLTVFFNASDSDDLKAKYSDDGKSIILYNPSRITKNTILTPEFNINPIYLNGGYIDENGYYHGDYYKKSFDVAIDIKAVTAEESSSPASAYHYARNMGLEVHTAASTTVSKARADVSLNWNSDWGETPADAKEYFYVVWSLTADNRNCNQPYQLKWSEDTIHDGEVVYSSPALGSWSSAYTSDGTHTTQVVTKHRRADVQNSGTEWAKVTNEAILSVNWNNGEYVEQFRASRTAEVYVPTETSGNFTFAKNIPNYTDQNKHSINGGQELILNGEPELMELPYEIGYAENKNTDNPTWNSETETYKTKKRTIVIEDGNPGDVMLSTDYGSSSRTWNSPYIKTLNQSDYYFSELSIALTEQDAVYLDGKWTDPFDNTDVANYGEIVVYAKTAGSDNLEVVSTLRGVNTATVTLPANTVYFKVEHTSDYFTTKLNVNPTMYLTASNRVRELVSNDVAVKRDTLVMNKCTITTTREGGQPVVTDSTTDAAWRSTYLLNISSSTLYAAKNCSNSNAVYEEGSTEECPVVISGWNYNNSARGYKKYIKSGIFNDLLPKDCTVDRSTVFVRPREENTIKQTSRNTSYFANYYNQESLLTKLPEGYFSVTFTDNWQDSGRTMMTVTVNAPDGEKYTGFDVFYKLKTTYSNINIYGINLINSVSFTDTTNGQSTPDLRSGLRTDLDAQSRPYYASIESPQTAYATAKTNLVQPPKFQYGADSSVRAEGSVYSKHEVVGLNTDYTYNVTYTGGDTSKTSDLVIYDVIEKQIDGPLSEWHGNFKSLDISAIKNLESANGSGKCAPVIYYSTKPKDSFTLEALDITKSDIWTTEKPDDSMITAIALDCTKSTGGSFVLEEKKSLVFNINMHSPSSEKQSELETYNEAIIKGKIVDLNVEIESKARTGVTLRFANPKLEKTAFPESGTAEKPENVVQGSVLEYSLKLTNPDQELSMTDIVVEDVFSNNMKFNNTIRVKLGDGEEIPVTKAARVSSYSVTENQTEEKTTFTATVSTLAPGETLTIIIPVTVTDAIGTAIDNKARVTSVNGVVYNIESGETHHVVSEMKAKVLKVNGKGDPLAGAVLQILDKDKNVMSVSDDGVNFMTEFTSTDEVFHFNIIPGTYYVREKTAPEGYNKSEDVMFTVDDEGIITVGGKDVSYVAVTDTPQYKVIFHDGGTDRTAAQFSNNFRVYEPVELNADKSITHFYDIPEWAGDEYVFAGWYHNSDYSTITKNQISNASIAADFENDKYIARNGDYHLYAKWIKVGKVNKAEKDTNIVANNQYRGFGLAGVQIREPEMHDSNYDDKITPAGLRFVTSLSEDLLRQIDEVSDKQVLTDEGYAENVEYGYVVATKANIDTFINHYNAVPSEYTLQYRGENVNGVNTSLTDKSELNVKNDYRYINSVLCTSSHPINGVKNGTEFVRDDHRNFDDYRLYTLVVTYEGDSASKKGESIDARAYIRYYDANGKLRVFYNNYNKSKYYGGCMCSYNQVAEMAIPVNKTETEENP